MFDINHQNLKVADATNTGYEKDQFDYSYSIGSLEHFTEKGIAQFINETSKIMKKYQCIKFQLQKIKNLKGGCFRSKLF